MNHDTSQISINKIARELGRVAGMKSLPKIFPNLQTYEGPYKITKENHLIEILSSCKTKNELFITFQKIFSVHQNLSQLIKNEIEPALNDMGFTQKDGVVMEIIDDESVLAKEIEINTKQYYSIRIGKNKNFFNCDLATLKKLFVDSYSEFINEGYFQEWFGYYCIDAGAVTGKLKNINAVIFRLIRKDNLWPIEEKIENYSEDDFFDMIEFLFDYVSKPKDGQFHSYNDCGWHYSTFNKLAGQVDFVIKMNEILYGHKTGFEISKFGQILIKEPNGLGSIFEEKISVDNDDMKTKIELAVQKYRESRSNLAEKRIAVRELADILEILKRDIKIYLNSKDEDALFNIANNFSIRHANDNQKIEYDRSIWFNWMFYFYLSTIHALLEIKKREKK